MPSEPRLRGTPASAVPSVSVPCGANWTGGVDVWYYDEACYSASLFRLRPTQSIAGMHHDAGL